MLKRKKNIGLAMLDIMLAMVLTAGLAYMIMAVLSKNKDSVKAKAIGAQLATAVDELLIAEPSSGTNYFSSCESNGASGFVTEFSPNYREALASEGYDLCLTEVTVSS